jgi:hypothetical protein
MTRVYVAMAIVGGALACHPHARLPQINQSL